MSSRILRASICASKKQYGSWASAKGAAQRTYRHTGERVGPYLCKDGCGMFHVGHSHTEIVREERHKAYIKIRREPNPAAVEPTH